MFNFEGNILKFVNLVREKCGIAAVLKNVKILNRGIVHSPDNIYWKNKVEREESCFIQLLGFSEFIAENVTLEGDYHIVVKDGERVTAVIENEQLIFKKEIDEGCDIRPSIAVTKAHILVPELLENIAKGVIRVDNDVNFT